MCLGKKIEEKNIKIITFNKKIPFLNNSNSIPNISFKSGSTQISGIEIITIQDLMRKKDDLDHSPEAAHQVAFNMIVYYTEGNSKHLVDFVWHEVNPGTLLYLTKGQVNAYHFTEDLKGYLILFTNDYFQRQLNSLPKETSIQLFTSHLFSPKIQLEEGEHISNYIRLFYQEFYAEQEIGYKVNVLNYLYHIILTKLEEFKQHQDLDAKSSDKLETFLQFKTLVEQDYRKTRNADYYAAELHMTYKHLNTISKAVVNRTAKQFIDEHVVLEAKRQLINSGIKSTELAFMMGFEESTNFVKYFKKHTGLTPNSFKNLYK